MTSPVLKFKRYENKNLLTSVSPPPSNPLGCDQCYQLLGPLMNFEGLKEVSCTSQDFSRGCRCLIWAGSRVEGSVQKGQWRRNCGAGNVEHWWNKHLFGNQETWDPVLTV